MERFRYLSIGLAVVLAFIGGKMLVGDVLEMPIWVSPAVIAIALAFAVTISLASPPRPARLPRAGETAAQP